MEVYNTTFVDADFAHGTALAFMLTIVTALFAVAVHARLPAGDDVTGRILARRWRSRAIVVWSLAPIVASASSPASRRRRDVQAVPARWLPEHPTLDAYHSLLGGTSSSARRRHGDRERHVRAGDAQQHDRDAALDAR